MRKAKRFLSSLLAAMMLLAAVPAALAADTGYSDVPADAWYAEAAAYCREQGLMVGVGGGRFAPEESLTRAQLVSILWRRAGSPVVNYLMQFTDVPQGRWYTEAVRWAASERVMVGYGGGRFGPGDVITQGQLNIVLGRYTDAEITQDIPGFAGGGAPATRAQIAAALLALAKQPEQESRTLVAYFSGSGNTERVAGYIAETLNADIFEITPVTPYTSADLDWTTSGSRVNREHENESLRDVPLAATTPDNWDEYDTVFLGYPIWWGIAAWPVDNFVEDNDFTGKTVIPFATSTSSGMGRSGELLAELAGTGDWQDGQRFSSGASQDQVTSWAESLDLPGGVK